MIHKDNIKKAITVLENVDKKEITLEHRFKDNEGRFCLNGIIVEKVDGYDKVSDDNGIILWMYDFYGIDTEANTGPSHVLTELHAAYHRNRISYDLMMKRALKYLRSLLK